MVWAKRRGGRGEVEIKAAKAKAARRYDGIMTCLGVPKSPVLRQRSFIGANSICANEHALPPPETFRIMPRHTPRDKAGAAVTKARVSLAQDLHSPYLPAAGLYSLLSDSFGPVP